MRALIDTDVLIDVGLQRSEWLHEAEAVFKWADRSGTAGVAWHSLSLIAFLMKRQAKPFLADVLERMTVVTTGHAEARAAMRLEMGDFEDAMQVVAALAYDAEVVVTRNAKHFRYGPIRAETPESFLRMVTPS